MCILVILSFSCTDENDGHLQLEKNTKSITGYLSDNSSFSILTHALELTDLAGTLNLYGTITLFAPTNAAFENYFRTKNISGIEQIEKEKLKNLIFYHLYKEIYTSENFLSGSLPEPTLQGGFIKMDISGGLKNTVLNNNVNVDTVDIQATNGVIHVISGVLEPPTETMYVWLSAQPEYSIMLEAFEKTGNDVLLKEIKYNHDLSTKWKSIFLESNQALTKSGINSYDDLAARFSDTGNPMNPEDSLNLFVRYHCIEYKFFLSDATDDYLETMKSGLYLIFSISPYIEINGTVIPEVEKSNNVTLNGIIHSIDTLMPIYEPSAVLLKQLFAGVPADRNIIINGLSINFTDQESFDLLNNDPEAQENVWWLKWEGIMTGTITSEWPANAFGDYCCVINYNDGPYTLELTTKPVFKGNYQLYVSYRRGSNPNYFAQFYWDDEAFGEMIDLTQGQDAFGSINASTDRQIYRGLGVVKCDEMKPHKFKLRMINPGASYTVWYSIELRPI
jgi:uncharacterized surface protein with fasciclin (FAS1) repeats